MRAENQKLTRAQERTVRCLIESAHMSQADRIGRWIGSHAPQIVAFQFGLMAGAVIVALECWLSRH